jgi:hypothetical protein
MGGVKLWLNQVEDFFDTDTQKLTFLYEKCLNSGSGYIEK